MTRNTGLFQSASVTDQARAEPTCVTTGLGSVIVAPALLDASVTDVRWVAVLFLMISRVLWIVTIIIHQLLKGRVHHSSMV